LYALVIQIAYVNHGRFPTEKAHGFQTAQVCDAMVSLGHDVTMFAPRFWNAITTNPKDYYHLRRELKVVRLAHFDAFRAWYVPGELAFFISMLSYGKTLRAFDFRGFDLLYVRSPLVLPALVGHDVPVILELHAIPRFRVRAFVAACNKCAKVVCLTRAMRDELVGLGVDATKAIVEGDGVDLRRFEQQESASHAKERWDLPHDSPIIGYVGSLATRETLEKGVRELIDAFATLKHPSALLWIVGGPKKWEDIYRAHAKTLGLRDQQIRFQGRIDACEVPSAISACDVCIYPAPKTRHPYFLRDTSPLKLFEYLAAGRPVICADLPPVRDVVDAHSVKFFEPGNCTELTDCLADALAHPDAYRSRAEWGKEMVKDRSWDRRMERILAQIR
jgi:glycosyltransferase involved in cell wall biosynthesis